MNWRTAASWWRCVAVLMCLWSVNALAHSLVLERAHYEDVSGKKTLDDLQGVVWQKYEGVFSGGYTASAHWIRLKIAGTDKELDTPWILRIQPTFVDELTIWDGNDLKRPQVIGDRHPWTNNEYLNFNFNVPLAKAAEPRYIWLRLQTKSTHLMDAEVLEVDEYIQASKKQAIFYTIVTVSILALFLIALLSYSMRPDPLRAIFALYLGTALLYTTAYTGLMRAYLYQIIYPAYLDLLMSFCVFNYTFASVFFYRMFLKEYQPKSWCFLYFNLFLGFYPMELLMLFSGHVEWALKTNALVIFMAPLFSLLAISLGVDWAHLGFGSRFLLSKRLLIAAYACLIVSLWSATLPALNWMRPIGYATDMLLMHGLVTGVVLTGLMYLRERKMRQTRLLEVSVSSRADEDGVRV